MAVKILHKISRATLILLLVSFFCSSVNAQAPRMMVEDGKIWVRNLDPEVLYTFTRYFNSQKDWESIFPVTTKENTNGIVLPGTYDVFDNAIRFTPRFPFAMHVVYVATFDAAQLAHNTNEVYLPAMEPDKLELEFSSSKATQPPAEVKAVYPSSNALPENLLKFHLVFSKPMTIGEVYTRVKLLDGHGKEVDKPFLVVDQELWDGQMKTVTILFDPGRIKRGLRPNLEMKPALAQGELYTLRVQEGWKDIDGLPTTKPFTKTFRCIKADRLSPVASSYEVIAPQFENSSLILNLREPHDFTLLSNGLKVFDSMHNIIEGTVIVRDNESAIEFVPKNPWLESNYTIRINPLLEDLAGNNLNRLFDEDLTITSSNKHSAHELNFKFSRPAN
jgi:hypothetical protein